MEYLEKHILVCFGSSCGPQGGERVREAFKSELKARGIRGRIRDGNCTCLGLCREGVNAVIWPEGTYLAGLVASDVPRVVDYLEGKGEIPSDRVVLASEKIALRKAEGK
ncbi:MAG: (2Fe-2S) ferredoxin domain-containing protein [Bdellovibrionota bacterium]